MEKEKDKKHWMLLNRWRWQFLSLSQEYKKIYQESLSSNKYWDLVVQCFNDFGIVLTRKYYDQKKLPDPSKPIEKQTAPIYFHDYYFHITGKSLFMSWVFRDNKPPCLNVSKLLSSEIIDSFKNFRAPGGFQTPSYASTKRVISLPQRGRLDGLLAVSKTAV